MRMSVITLFVLIGTHGLALFAEDQGRTPEQWLATIEEQAIAEKNTWDAEWRAVMRGAAIALDPWDGRPPGQQARPDGLHERNGPVGLAWADRADV